MNDTMVKNMKAMMQSGAVAHGIEAMRGELKELTRVERAVLACALGHALTPDELLELEALRGEDGKAWRRLKSSIGMRVLPDGTPQVWTGDTLPPPMPGEVAADSLRAGRRAGRWLQ